MDLKEQEILGAAVDSHWYYRSKARVLERMLPRPFNRVVMDVGAGSGYFTRHLAKRGLIDGALCVDIGYERDHDEQVGSAMIRYRKAPEKSNADVALFMDILEHVPDDASLLASYREFLPATAHVIITVPAFKFLWSGHDIFLQHYRRYTLATLSDTIQKAGYRLVQGHYFYGLVFPAAVAARLLTPNRMAPRSSLKVHGNLTNSVLYAASAMELPLMKFNKLAGLSVCAVCRPA